MNIYPYNMYFLYAACAFLICYLIIFFLKAMNFLKTMKTTNVSIQVIKDKVDHLQYVSNAINEQKKAKKTIQNQLIKILLPIVVSIILTYRQNDELEGFKGYVAASKREFAKRGNSEIIKRIFTN